MKKILAIVMAMLCATALVANGASKPKKAKLTAEQQAVQKDLLAKYDTNKDGKLDKNERAAMSKEDKDKMTKVGLSKTAKKSAATKPTTGSSTNAPAQ
jgi:hypothetical protein